MAINDYGMEQMPENIAFEMQEDDTPQVSGAIQELLNSNNIAEDLTDKELDEIGSMVIQHFEIDYGSQAESMKLREDAIKLAKQTAEHKDFPFNNASNIKFPLLTKACLEFWSRAESQIVQNGSVCRATKVGKDPSGEKYEKSLRYSDFQNYQLSL